MMSRIRCATPLKAQILTTFLTHEHASAAWYAVDGDCYVVTDATTETINYAKAFAGVR